MNSNATQDHGDTYEHSDLDCPICEAEYQRRAEGSVE